MICTRCSKIYTYKRKSGSTLSFCGACRVTIARQKLKKRAIEYKGGKCFKCGYHKAINALTFHHLDPKTKEFNFSSSRVLGWEKIKKEIDKCIILCLNCHAETNAGM